MSLQSSNFDLALRAVISGIWYWKRKNKVGRKREFAADLIDFGFPETNVGWPGLD